MVKASSDLMVSKSPAHDSGVVPLFPVVWESGSCWIFVEDEANEASEEVVGVSVAEELGNTFKGDDPDNGPDNKPEIRQRLRTFHTV